MNEYTFNLKDLVVVSTSPVRRNDAGNIVQQCDVELDIKGVNLGIVGKEVLKQLLDFCYESVGDEPLTASMFNFMYRNCIKHKPSSFSLKEIIKEAILHADNVEITFIVSQGQVMKIPQKKPLKLDDMFYTTCRDTLSSVVKNANYCRNKFLVSDPKATKEMIKVHKGSIVGNIFRANLITEGLTSNNGSPIMDITLEITQLPKEYVITVRVKCGSGYVQPVHGMTLDGLVCMENNDVLHNVLRQILENLDEEMLLDRFNNIYDKKAWDKYSPNLWFSDKNKLERQNYLFFL